MSIRLHTLTVSAGAEAARAFLVPGNDLCAEFYRPLAEELAGRGLTTTLATLPGFNGLPGWSPPRVEAYVEEIRRGAREAMSSDGVLLGHSLGGLFAFLALAGEPTLARRLLLLEPFILPSRRLARGAARTYRAQVVEGQGDAFRNWTGSFRRVHDLERFPAWAIELYLEVRRTTAPGTVAALMDQLEGLYPLPFAQVQAPVRILRGARSGWRNRLMHSALRFTFGRATVRAVPGLAHWMANEDDPTLAEAIVAFALEGVTT